MATFAYKKRGACYWGLESAFGDGAGEDLRYVKLDEITMPEGIELGEDEHIEVEDVEDVPTLLYQPGEAQFTMPVYPAVSDWPTAAPDLESTRPPSDEILRAVLGDPIASGYGEVTAGCDVETLQFDIYGDTPETLGFAVGSLVAVRDTDDDHVSGVSRVQAVDNSAYTVTLMPPLPSAPSSGDKVYGFLSYPKQTLTSTPTIEVKHLGELACYVEHAYGAVVQSLKLEAPYREKGKWTGTLQCARPVPRDPDETGGAPSAESWGWPAASQVLHGGLYLAIDQGASWTVGRLTGGITIDFGIEVEEIAGVNGVDPNGIAGYKITVRKVRVTVEPAYTDNNHMRLATAASDTTAALVGWWGRGPSVTAFCIPSAVLVERPQLQGDSIVSAQLVFGCQSYSGDTDDGGDGVNAPFVFGQLAG